MSIIKQSERSQWSKMKGLALFASLGCLIASGVAHAGPVVSGFTNEGPLPTCDDCYSGATALGFTANFFGSNYTQAYVSNNGYATFNSGQGTYTPPEVELSGHDQPLLRCDPSPRTTFRHFSIKRRGSLTTHSSFLVFARFAGARCRACRRPGSSWCRREPVATQ